MRAKSSPGVTLYVFLAVFGTAAFLFPFVVFLWWAVTGQSLVAHPFWLTVGCLMVAGGCGNILEGM